MNIKIHVGSRMTLLPSEVIYFKADSNYTKVYLTSGREKLLSINLKKIEERFGAFPNFIRPHRSFFINLSYATLAGADGSISVSDKVVINIPRRKKQMIEKAILAINPKDY